MAAPEFAGTVGTRSMSAGRSLLVLGSLSVFGPLSMDLYLPSLPQLADHLHTTPALAQATMSTCMIGLGLGQLFVGPISDRVGRRRPILIGVALFTILSFACAVAPNIQVLLLLRFLQGLAGSAGLVVSMATARDMFDGPLLSKRLSMISLVSASAPVLAPIAGGQLARIMDWREIFLVLTAIGVGLVTIAFFGLRETLAPELRHRGGLRTTTGQFAQLARDRTFRGLICVSACTSTAFFAYLSMGSFVFENEFGVTPVEFSLIYAGVSIAFILGAQLNGLVVRRLGSRRMFATGLIVGACASIAVLLGMIHAGPMAFVIAALWVFLLSEGVASPNSTTLALSNHGSRAGTAASVSGMTTFMVGPIVAPIASVGGVTGPTMATTMMVSMLLAVGVATLVLRGMRRRVSLG